MAIANRKTRRDHLQDLLIAKGNWQEVYKSQPPTFDGQSPVATVHSGGVETPQETFGGDEDVEMELLVTNFVKREEVDAAEDALDDLLVALIEVVLANDTAAGYWNDLQIRGATEPDYVMVDGEQYRSESVRVVATVYG